MESALTEQEQQFERRFASMVIQVKQLEQKLDKMTTKYLNQVAYNKRLVERAKRKGTIYKKVLRVLEEEYR